MPMSFNAVDRANMEFSFPSKLTDYTTAGLPLLIYGPHYCSAVQWARENPGVAEVVTADNAETLARTVGALAETPVLRAELGARALAVGDRYFSCVLARSVFHGAVATGAAKPRAPFRSRKLLTPLFNRVALAMFRALPSLLARHLMFVLRSHPEITDDWGYHVRPVHYDEPLPDFAAIKPAQTQRRRLSPAIDFDLPGQIALLRRLGVKFRTELEELARGTGAAGFDFNNDYFANLDAALYYALIRDLKPRRVIEIGGGFSTRIASRALECNGRLGQPGALTCIEPYPQPRLTEAGLNIELIERPVEQLELEVFERLDGGDILFIDSSHAVKFGGDVCHEFLEILPVLKPGVWVHVHDIFFPEDYPAEWLIQKRIAFNEQYLLEGFLAFNAAFSVKAANHWLCLEHPADAAQLWPPSAEGRGLHGRGSFWMKRER